MNTDAVDWDHFGAYMSRAAGRTPVIALLMATFSMSLIALAQSNPDAARELVNSWVLATVAGYEIDAMAITFIMAASWVTVPFVQAFQAFLPLSEVLQQ